MKAALDLTATDLLDFRKEFGFSQSEFGEGADIPRGYVSSVEQGTRPVTKWFADRAAPFMAFVRKCSKEGRL